MANLATWPIRWIPSTNVIQLTLSLKVTTAQQVFGTSVALNNRPIQNYAVPERSCSISLWYSVSLYLRILSEVQKPFLSPAKQSELCTHSLPLDSFQRTHLSSIYQHFPLRSSPVKKDLQAPFSVDLRSAWCSPISISLSPMALKIQQICRYPSQYLAGHRLSACTKLLYIGDRGWIFSASFLHTLDFLRLYCTVLLRFCLDVDSENP